MLLNALAAQRLEKAGSVQVGKHEQGTEQSPAPAGPRWQREHSWLRPGGDQSQPRAGGISALQALLILALWWRWLGKVLKNLRLRSFVVLMRAVCFHFIS